MPTDPVTPISRILGLGCAVSRDASISDTNVAVIGDRFEANVELPETPTYTPNLGPDDSLDHAWCDLKDLGLRHCDAGQHEALGAQGCFQVPSSAWLVIFLKCYFLHVHPMLPMIRECDFWAILDSNDEMLATEVTQFVSLPLLQAILFAASPVGMSREAGFLEADS